MEGLLTKLEMTQEEIFTSSDEQDAQKREEEEGEFLIPSAEKVNVDTKSERTTTSSDMSGRGSRSRGSSTMSTSSGSCLEELRFMIQSLSTKVQNSSNLGEVMRSEHAATANAIANLGTDVKRVITKVDIIEEEVERRRRYLRRRTQKVEERSRSMKRKFNRWRKTLRRRMLEKTMNALRELGKRWKVIWEKSRRDNGLRPLLPSMDGWTATERWKR